MLLNVGFVALLSMMAAAVSNSFVLRHPSAIDRGGRYNTTMHVVH